MRVYNNAHPYYCGIDLHSRLLYVCIIDDKGEVLVHKKIKDDKQALMMLLEPYIENEQHQRASMTLVENNLMFTSSDCQYAKCTKLYALD